MTSISNALFWISNGLLVPVVVLLLLFFLRAILMVGGFFGEFWQKTKLQQQMNDMLEKMTPENAEELYRQLSGNKNIPVLHCLHKLYDHKENDAYCERLLANYEVDAEKELGRSRSLIKLGPMLGLMGTLIPMGPALVGLSTGDIASMAYNMQVAFATTVVGMVIAAIGVITLQVKQRWYARDMNDLEYIYKTCAMKRNKLLHSEADADPMGVVANLFDVAMVFAVALMVALVTRFNMTELFSKEDFSIVKNPGKENMEIITKEGESIHRYIPSEQQEKSGKKGRKVGIAYELENGEIIYVPE